jgi:glycogen synthase
VLSWWQAVHGTDAPHEWELYRRHVRLGILAASAMIAPSHAMLSQVHRWYGRPRLELVIPNGRDPNLFCPGRKRAYILSVGRLWDDAKNIAALDAIAGELDWPVFIAGDRISPEGSFVQMLNSTVLGRLSPPSLRDWLATASICALPARYEPFGLSELEAALSGCALVIGDIDSLRETWHGAAMFVPPDDRAQLRDILNHLIHNPDLLRALAGRARQRALTFNSRQTAEAYLATYSSLIADREIRGELPCGS